MHDSALPESGLAPSWVPHVIQKVQSLRFGSVQIKIHEGEVVVVEATEQTRFLPPSKSVGGKAQPNAKRATPTKQ